MPKGKFFKKSNQKSKNIKKKQWFLFFWFFIPLTASALVFAFYFLALHLAWFQLRTLEVRGVESESEKADLLEKVGVQEGDSLLKIRLPALVERLKEIPSVDRVKVTRRFPHTLIIQVAYQEPRMILHADRLYYLNQRGEIFKTVSSLKDLRDFPVLTGLTRSEMERDPQEAREVLRQALHLLELYEKSDAFQGIGLSEIHYDAKTGFDLFPEHQKLRLIFGFQDLEVKVKRLDQALSQLNANAQRDRFAAIDLNYEGKVVLSL